MFDALEERYSDDEVRHESEGDIEPSSNGEDLSTSEADDFSVSHREFNINGQRGPVAEEIIDIEIFPAQNGEDDEDEDYEAEVSEVMGTGEEEDNDDVGESGESDENEHACPWWLEDVDPSFSCSPGEYKRVLDIRKNDQEKNIKWMAELVLDTPDAVTKGEAVRLVTGALSKHNAKRALKEDIHTVMRTVLGDNQFPSAWRAEKMVRQTEGDLEVIRMAVCRCRDYVFREHTTTQRDKLTKEGKDGGYKMRQCPLCSRNRPKAEKAKIFRYIPIASQMRNIMMNERKAKAMYLDRLNGDAPTDDEDMKDITDTPGWREKTPSFLADDPRNMVVGFSTDGFSPLKEHRKYSMWPFTFQIFNFPREMRVFHNNILFCGTTSGPKKPKSLTPFLDVVVEELEWLLVEGVAVFDAHAAAHGGAGGHAPIFMQKCLLLLIGGDQRALELVTQLQGAGAILGCRKCWTQGQSLGYAKGIVYNSRDTSETKTNEELLTAGVEREEWLNNREEDKSEDPLLRTGT